MRTFIMNSPCLSPHQLAILSVHPPLCPSSYSISSFSFLSLSISRVCALLALLVCIIQRDQDGQYYWPKNATFVNVIGHVGNCDKKYWWDLKNLTSINNLTDHQIYQTSFVIFDAESNFEYIYPVFYFVIIFQFCQKINNFNRSSGWGGWSLCG